MADHVYLEYLPYIYSISESERQGHVWQLHTPSIPSITCREQILSTNQVLIYPDLRTGRWAEPSRIPQVCHGSNMTWRIGRPAIQIESKLGVKRKLFPVESPGVMYVFPPEPLFIRIGQTNA